MATLTALALHDAQRLGSLFGLDVTAVHGIPAGSVNSNYRLDLTDGERAFLRVYEEQNAEAAAREARMLEHLSSGGVDTPRPRSRTDGSLVAEHCGKPVAVFPWVLGESVCQKRVTPERMRRVGEALARVHVAGAELEGTPESRFDRDALLARLERIPTSSLTDELRPLVGDLVSRVKSAPPRAPSSLGVIHGDLFRDNVLWDGDAISALLDFESASAGSAAFDISVTMLAWCFGDDLDPALARALVDGYRGARDVTNEERDHLYSEACFAALRFTVTRITDFELRPRGLGVFRDYRRFVARTRALERLGAEGLLTLVGL